MSNHRLVIPALLIPALLFAGCEAVPTGLADSGPLVLPIDQMSIAVPSTGTGSEALANFAAAVSLHEQSDRLLEQSQGGPLRSLAEPRDKRGAPSEAERQRLRQESDGLWALAVERYRKVLALDIRSAAACERLSAGYFLRRDAVNGLRWLKEAARLKPGDFGTLFRLGVQSERAGRVAEAVDAFAQAERAGAGDADEKLRALPLVLLKLASLQKSQGRLADAAASYERFMKLPPQSDVVYEDNPPLIELLKNHGPVHRELAEIYRKLGQSDRAVAAWRESLKLQPAFPQALLRIAEIHRDAGNFPAAVAACKEYIEKEPGRLDGMSFLVDLYKSSGQIDQAVGAAEEFLKEKPFLYQLHYLLGTLYESQGAPDKALSEYEVIARDGKKFLPAYLRLADLETKRGKPERALAGLARGLAAGLDEESFYGELDRRIVEAAKSPGIVGRFRLAVEPDRQDFAFYYVIGRLEQQAKRLAESAAAYRETVRLKGDFTQASIRLAGVLVADNKAKEAAGTLRAAAERERGNMLLWRFLADAELAAGNPAGAADAMTRVVEIDPVNVPNVAMLVSLLGDAGRLDDAEALIEKRIADDSEDERWTLLLADFLARHNRKLDRAEAALHDALDDDPESPALTLALGRVRLVQRDYPAAVAALRDAVRLEPENLAARVLLARAFEGDRKLDEAEKTLRDARVALPAEPAAMVELGRFLVRTKKSPEEGIALLRQAAAADPADPDAEFAVAAAYTHLKRHAEAVPLLLELLRKHPDFTAAHYSLAGVYDELGDFPKAEAELKGVLAKSPDDDTAANNLGYMYAERGVKLDEAERLIEGAIQREPANGGYLDSLGWVYYRKGDFQKAHEYLTKAIALQKDAVIVDHLGDACWKLGRKEDALAHYKDAAKLDEGAQTAAAKKVEAVKAGKDPMRVVK
jgi:tetratricopeptide (TPR) repeat protein